MSKTTQQIAEDCGINEIGRQVIGALIASSDAPVNSPAHLIGALYRRIEKLEEVNAQQAQLISISIDTGLPIS